MLIQKKINFNGNKSKFINFEEKILLIKFKKNLTSSKKMTY